MKKILKALAILTISTPISLTTVACNNSHTIQKTDLSQLQNKSNVVLQNTNKTVSDFKNQLIIQLQKENRFSNLQLNDITIVKLITILLMQKI